MKDVIIIGTGPAGLMAAAKLSETKKDVLILEKQKTPGNKLLITGNSRCNLTNLKPYKEFLDQIDYNKKYLYSAINLFGPNDIYDYFNQRVKLKEEKDNRIFPVSNKASDILDFLLSKNKYPIYYGQEVINIIKHDNSIEVITSDNSYKTKNLIIAVGGASYKNTGSTGDILKFAKNLNHPVVDLFPAEVGITLKEKHNIPGLSIENVEVKINKIKKTGFLIYTHLGISGEAVMKISEHVYLNKSKNIEIDFLPNLTNDSLKEEILSEREKNISTMLSVYFMKNFSKYILNKCNVEDKKVKQLNIKQIDDIVNFIKGCIYEVKAVDKLDFAYVTGGGINLNHINTKTFESKIHENIYFAGECLDIHGPVGGYNITLALSTGYCAATDIIND